MCVCVCVCVYVHVNGSYMLINFNIYRRERVIKGQLATTSVLSIMYNVRNVCTYMFDCSIEGHP